MPTYEHKTVDASANNCASRPHDTRAARPRARKAPLQALLLLVSGIGTTRATSGGKRTTAFHSRGDGREQEDKLLRWGQQRPESPADASDRFLGHQRPVAVSTKALVQMLGGVRRNERDVHLTRRTAAYDALWPVSLPAGDASRATASSPPQGSATPLEEGLQRATRGRLSSLA